MSNHDFMIEQAEARVSAEIGNRLTVASQMVAKAGRLQCVDCGEDIEQRRRLAAPFARRCIECQRLKEANK